MGCIYYLACRECKEMVRIGKMEVGYYADQTKAFMSEHILHPLVIVGDQWNRGDVIYSVNDGMWDTDYRFFDMKLYRSDDITVGKTHCPFCNKIHRKSLKYTECKRKYIDEHPRSCGGGY